LLDRQQRIDRIRRGQGWFPGLLPEEVARQVPIRG
jgi:hypothetical protein